MSQLGEIVRKVTILNRVFKGIFDSVNGKPLSILNIMKFVKNGWSVHLSQC